MSTTAARLAGAPERVPMRSQLRAFMAICERDLWVTFRRQPVVFIAQSLLQPIFFLFIFGRVLPAIGAANASYSTLLFPGIVALTLFLTSLQNVALPLVIEFGWTKEIEDRLLAPLPSWAVAAQKVFISAFRAIIAGLFLFPLAYLILPGFALTGVNIPLLVLIAVLAPTAAACLGMVLGTTVPPQQINLMTPLIMTGATYYPWASLGSLPWFQAITLLNPLTYASEGMRAALTPEVPHMDLMFVLLGLGVSIVGFGAWGVRGFLRRAID
jgi:ABC-2 type transport system permease protein